MSPSDNIMHAAYVEANSIFHENNMFMEEYPEEVSMLQLTEVMWGWLAIMML